MGIIFAKSWDEGSPLAGWTSTSGSLVPGRTNQGFTGTANKTWGSPLASVVNATAYQSSSFTGKLRNYNPSVTESCEINLVNVGDGRFKIEFISIFDEFIVIPFAINQGDYFYIEFNAQISGFVVDDGMGHKTLTVSGSYALNVNNTPIQSGPLSHSGATSRSVGAQADIAFSDFTTNLGGVVDDMYFRDDSTFLGDSTVDASDNVTQNVVDVDFTQATLEAAQSFTSNTLEFTQVLLEVILGLGLACPSSAAALGVPYSSSFVAAAGTAPYTFAIISGSLPPGLTLNTSTGLVSGIPTTSGFYSYTGQVTDANGRTATASCTIAIGGSVCDSVSPQPSTDVYFELQRVYATMKPAPRIPVRGS